jgi:uncharacterized protein DUF4153
MKNKILENIFILISGILFYILFWQEKMGINVLLFTLLMLAFLYYKKPELKDSKSVVVTSLGTFILAILIVWNNSLMSKVIYLISFTTLIGLAKQTELRFLGYGFLLSLVSFFETPIKLVQQFSQKETRQSLRLAPVWRSFRLSLIPLLVLLVFYAIYHISNPEFRNFSNHFWINVIEWFSWNISLPQVLFFISGIIISAAILMQCDFPFFKNLQNISTENLARLRNRFPFIAKGMIALKSEFQSGLILLFSLNVLLLFVNFLDIRSFWFSKAYELSPIEMKAMVHEGTYFLIAGLLLAMIVISYFFRKNLNFYPNNQKLKIAGYLWIVQNGVLAISLFIKNYRYIEANDLAYKRIGVLIFLILVFAGLITMILKIKDQKTFYFLLHRNAWIAYGVFIISSFVNWDVVITNYNLSSKTKNEIDYSFLISDVSDKNIYLLLEHEKNNLLPKQKNETIKYAIKNKKNTFLKKQENLSWLSWNRANQYNLDYLAKENN